ncbi:Mss4-like protein [Hyaloscypha variabilis]
MSADHGKCHCGQIEREVKLEDRAHVLCHCDTCKQLGGGAYSLNQILPKENLKLTKGKLNTYTYHGDSGKPVNCYIALIARLTFTTTRLMGDKIVVRIILLDQGKSLKPSAEVFGKDRLPWEIEVAQTFQVMPPS